MAFERGEVQENRESPEDEGPEASPLLIQSTVSENDNGGGLFASSDHPIHPVLASVPEFSHSTAPYEWPVATDDDSAIERNDLCPLPLDKDEIRRKVTSTGKIAVRSITWNQQAQELPHTEDLTHKLFLKGYFHLVAVGTQECENSISKSILNPSKANWEKICSEAMGCDYELIRGHSLQASHLAVFVHKAIIDLVSNVKSHAVATGICDTLGNKGGIGISFMIGKTSYCFLTAHLAAHQNQIVRRTAEFAKISREVTRELGRQENNLETSLEQEISNESMSIYREDGEGKDSFEDNISILTTQRPTNNITGKVNECFCPTCPNSLRSCCSSCCCPDHNEDKFNPLPHSFDYVIWAGDLNFRINGTRDVVNSLLAHNRYNVLMDYDQLNMLIQFDSVFAGFEEGKITFRPTYKFDKGTDEYDTSAKRRIPAWTDRVVYKSNPSLQLLSYSSVNGIKSSDHRPVYASFISSVEIDNFRSNTDSAFTRSESRSQVCVIS